jgi:hypothetical protein
MGLNNEVEQQGRIQDARSILNCDQGLNPNGLAAQGIQLLTHR